MEKWLHEKGKSLILLVIFILPGCIFGQFLVKYDSVNYEVEIYLSDNAVSSIDTIPIVFGVLKAFQLKDSTLYYLIESTPSQEEEEKRYDIYCCRLREKGGYVVLYNFWFKSERFKPYEVEVFLNEKGLSFEIDEGSMWLIYSYGQIDEIRELSEVYFVFKKSS